jgi:hypothetical protein
MFFLPNYNAIDDARKARLEFARALGAYIDLVALERNNGSGATAGDGIRREVGDSWVFTRLSEELTRSRWSGLPPWDALHTLAEELGLPELDDFADIMRLSGEEGASVYSNLRARSAAMRTAMLNDEIAQANAVGERMTIPGSLLGVIFMALLVAPSLLRMFKPTEQPTDRPADLPTGRTTQEDPMLTLRPAPHHLVPGETDAPTPGSVRIRLATNEARSPPSTCSGRSR